MAIEFFISSLVRTNIPTWWRLLHGLVLARVEHTLDGMRHRWPFAVFIFLVQYFCMRSTVKPGQVAKYPRATALIQAEIGAERHVRWRKLIKVSTCWISYALLAVWSDTLGTGAGGTLGTGWGSWRNCIL